MIKVINDNIQQLICMKTEECSNCSLQESAKRLWALTILGASVSTRIVLNCSIKLIFMIADRKFQSAD